MSLIARLDDARRRRNVLKHPFYTRWSRGELGLMALSDGPIRTPADLEGEKVGIFGGLVYDEVCRPKYLEANGVDPESIETVDIGFSSVPPLLAPSVPLFWTAPH